MKTILRNALLCVALAGITYAIAVMLAPENLENYAPTLLPAYARLAFAFSALLSVGVFATSALLMLVVDGRWRWLWVLGYAVLWCALILYLNFPANRYRIGFDATTAWLVWPAILALACSLLGARMAMLVRR